MLLRKKLVWLMLLACLLAGSASAQDLPSVTDLEIGAWTSIPVDGATCALGTPYSFFVRPAESANLMVYFQGGGACWNNTTCTADGPFDKTVSPVEEEIGLYDGVFNFANAENPLADYNVVFVPYCTGDVHVGNATGEFNGEAVSFNGAPNARAVLDWAYANYPTVERVLVTGSSAGAYGAAYHSSAIFTQYADADQVLLGDAGVGVIPEGWNGLSVWGVESALPGMDEIDLSAQFNNDVYTGTSVTFPDARLAQYTNFADSVQVTFYAFQGGDFFGWVGGMRERLDALNAELPNFRSYMAWGDAHTILASPEFYTMQVNGVRFLDWFNALNDGTTPESVACTECTEEEVYTP